MAMPRKSDSQKRKPTGVSLEAALLTKAKAQAKREGYGSLSAFITKLLRDAVQEAKDAAEKAGHGQIKKAQGKVRRR
jgi:metal-responsive CopG/Arc/MetJ family transcriptional regulator